MFRRRRRTRDEGCPRRDEVVVPMRLPRREPTPPEIQAFGRQPDDTHTAVRAAHVYTDVLRAILEFECVRWHGDDREPLRRLRPPLLRQIAAASKTFEQTVDRALRQIDEQLATNTRASADIARYPSRREGEQS
jgi:hypothetical protein